MRISDWSSDVCSSDLLLKSKAACELCSIIFACRWIACTPFTPNRLISQACDLLRDQSNQEDDYGCTEKQHAHIRETPSSCERVGVISRAQKNKGKSHRRKQFQRRIQRRDPENTQKEPKSIAHRLDMAIANPRRNRNRHIRLGIG